MTIFVVDTNVAIAANGNNTHADPKCQLQCIRKIIEIIKKNKIAIDDHDRIFNEYKKYLNFNGVPGTGDMLFKHIYNNKYNKNKILLVNITESTNRNKGFEELEINQLDPSDRKFLAVAKKAKAIIVNATDSDWEENADFIERTGVTIEQLCTN